MSCTTVAMTISDPSCSQVKLRKPHPNPHEYVVPSKFATIPTNNIQRRMMNQYYSNNSNNNRRPSSIRQRFSLPPSIKEEEDEDNENIILDTCSSYQRRHYSYPGPSTTTTTTTTRSMMAADDHDNDKDKGKIKEEGEGEEEEEEEEDMIPLAMLAFRKGFVVADKLENVFPLVQHIPPFPNSSHYQTPPFILQQQQQQQQDYFQYRNDPSLMVNAYKSSKRIMRSHPPAISNDQIAHLANITNKQHQQQPIKEKKTLLRTPFYQLSQSHSYPTSLSSNSSSSSSSASSLISTPPSSPKPTTSMANSMRRKSLARHPSSPI